MKAGLHDSQHCSFVIALTDGSLLKIGHFGEICVGTTTLQGYSVVDVWLDHSIVSRHQHLSRVVFEDLLQYINDIGQFLTITF